MEARPANTHLRQIRRRVPPERRQRAEISCDRCRNKRCKCIRSSTTDTCQACRSVGQPCQTTRSRKYNSALAPFEDPRFDKPQPQSIQSLHPPTSPPAFDLVSAASSEPPTTSSRAPLSVFNMPTERLPVDPPLSTVDHIPSSQTTPTASGVHFLVYDPSTVDLVSLTTTDPVSSLKSEAPVQHGTGDHNIDLPPREVADTLIKLFFDKVHCDFPILHRTLFQVHYEKTRASTKYRHDHQYTPKPDPAWLVCLFMVFVLGLEVVPSALSPSSTPQGAIRRRLDDAVYRGGLQKKYLTKSKELLLEVLAGTLLVHVQALLLYCRYLHITCSRGACWNLSGAAIRIAVAIGLNCTGN